MSYEHIALCLSCEHTCGQRASPEGDASIRRGEKESNGYRGVESQTGVSGQPRQLRLRCRVCHLLLSCPHGLAVVKVHCGLTATMQLLYQGILYDTCQNICGYSFSSLLKLQINFYRNIEEHVGRFS